MRLFSTILRKDPDGYWLVTPVEKQRLTVEDAPFVAVRVDQDGEMLRFLTNVGAVVEAGPGNRIRVEIKEATPEPRPLEGNAVTIVDVAGKSVTLQDGKRVFTAGSSGAPGSPGAPTN